WSVTTVERALAELRAHWHAALLAQRDDPASAFMRLLDLHAAVSQPGTVAAPLHRSLINQLRLIELHTQAVRPRPIGLLDAHIRGHEYALAALRQGDSAALPEALRAVSGDYLYR
ncbi:MAG: hypothetical protein NZM00_13530, partial [Anaerolinea sp.]|nr:hypothetical protein [Anaerolinea sp.]